jgi:nicotinate-nucleotide adenylyltransferase
MEKVIGARARLEMVQLATRTNPFFSASAIELERPGKSYSVDTLHYFNQNQAGARLFFITGKDAFVEIETWKEYAALFSLADFIVMLRPGIEEIDSVRLPDSLAPSFSREGEPGTWRHRSGHTVSFREIMFLDLSSTRVRQLLERGRSVRYMVPFEVEAYIEENRLYRR